MRIVGCFLEYEDTFLILRRHPDKPEGNTWGLPAGKLETGEKDEDGMVRELFQETGKVALASELEYIDTYDFVTPAGNPYTFVAYRHRLTEPFEVVQEKGAHIDSRWVRRDECYAMPDLIPDFHTLLELTGYVTVE